ncbi:Gata zinc finger protein [Thalictrum thalictroides]|uniref:Gata zinc finger protein n=1 Tax=Thalictrum thalictroides TaxID=46969 RepID=A0A7J6WGM7_THATH|nr:Gata zinc finger protein [Thalictrum thalictroides]
MADRNDNQLNSNSQSRPVGGTEFSWCRAVPGGTGISVLALLLSKHIDIQILQNALNKLQISHPILRSKLTYTDPITFTIPSSPHIQIQFHDLTFTSNLIQSNPFSESQSLSPFHRVLEHELSQNDNWPNPFDSVQTDSDTFYCNLYAIEETKWVLTFRLHTSVCDRTTAVVLLKEYLDIIRKEEGVAGELGSGDELNLGIEELIPNGKANKPFWARGVDLLGYSLNSFRFANVEFKDVESTRTSGVVRVRFNSDQTDRILAGCKARGIKLCGSLAAAAIMAAYSSKDLPDHQWEKYAVVTLVDCRKELDPPLQSHNFGFYHSAILNTHDIAGETELWELSNRCYTACKNAINSNKHFSDMNDLNYLMCKAIDNPGLTTSSSLRTSFIAVFEDPVFEDSRDLQQEIGLEDYVGCSSVHGVGPSIAVFDTIRNGELDCSCVYPKPLHSREQMQELIDDMKRILVNGSA